MQAGTGPAVEPCMASRKPFPARFEGTCPRCGRAIEPGTPITGEPRAWVHLACVSEDEFAAMALVDVDSLIGELLAGT
jgi:hypothetical protein